MVKCPATFINALSLYPFKFPSLFFYFIILFLVWNSSLLFMSHKGFLLVSVGLSAGTLHIIKL